MTTPEATPARGLLIGLAAYVIWGLSPIFWKQLGGVAALDTVAWRVTFASVTLVVLVVVLGRRADLRAAAASPRDRLASTAAAALIAVNWLVYVWAIGDERVVEASLGYFMNPIMNVVLGVVVLRERLRSAQWTAVAFASAGVLWLTITLGTLPWVSLTLALSFALYGLIRKVAPAGPVVGLSMEMALLILPALLLLAARGNVADDVTDGSTAIFLVLTGLITAVPLLLFTTSARAVPLSTLGLLQYVAPTLQFLLGVLVYDEAFDRTRLIGYSVVWLGLAVFAVDSVRHSGARRLSVSSARVGSS